MVVVVPLFAIIASGCAGSDEPECPTELRSEFETNAGSLTSGTRAVAVQWSRQQGTQRPEYHGALLLADHTVSADISVDTDRARGIPGTRSVLWLPEPSEVVPFEVTFARVDGSFVRTLLDPVAWGRDATFDGTRYQVFWSNATGVYHQSMSEDGELGTMHVLAMTASKLIVAASSETGATLVNVGATAYFVDTQKGTLTQVLDETAAVQQAFFFAGQFHLHDGGELVSITPAGAVTRRPLLDRLTTAQQFHATANKLVVDTALEGVLEVDANLAIVAEQPGLVGSTRAIGLLGDDYVQLQAFWVDLQTHAPGHVDVIGSTWRVQLATDSPVREVSLCDPR